MDLDTEGVRGLDSLLTIQFSENKSSLQEFCASRITSIGLQIVRI